MPLLPSRASVGSTVGKRVFGTSNPQVIQRKLQRLDQDALKAALRSQGFRGGMTASKLAQVLSGEVQTGKRNLGGAVKALQSRGATHETMNAGQLLQQSTKRALQDESYRATGTLRPSAATFGKTASIGSRVAAARAAADGEHVEKPLEQARSIKEVREMLRALGIQSRKIAKKLDDPTVSAGNGQDLS